MSVQCFVERNSHHLGWRLTSLYARYMAWYVLAVAVLWFVGIEGIYGHPTPFYAYILPVFSRPLQLAAAVVGLWLVHLLWHHVLFPSATRDRSRVAVAVVPWALAAVLIAAGFVRAASAEGLSFAALLAEFWQAVRWQLPAVAVFVASLALWRHVLGHMNWFEGDVAPRTRRWILLALVVFCIAFPIAVAMIRDGMTGVTAAYNRYSHEYINDIGQGGSIQGLFRDYNKLHEYLSMHSKVHPPGPVALLWMLSYVTLGRGPLELSLATIIFGSLTVIPLFFWVRDMVNERVAYTACFLYALVPTIVLFTATSADILFMPFTVTTLFLFWRAIHRRSVMCALAAGVFYGVISLLSFSLIGIGAFFGFVGLWRMRRRANWRAVVQTAVLMLAAFLAVHVAVRWWSGFDVVECFRLCKAQFDQDQLNLDIFTPRYPGWVYRLLNPACWVFFAGIPVTILFVWRLTRPHADTKALFIVFALTLLVLNLLYLARGEGERSAMYLMPFLVIPAAHLLDEVGRTARSTAPMLATLAFMAVQCWLIETNVYTYW
ncbi:MAG: hypothetical protein GY851_17905 [bacterium]|nr:hypothetical protein [bacterium]